MPTKQKIRERQWGTLSSVGFPDPILKVEVNTNVVGLSCSALLSRPKAARLRVRFGDRTNGIIVVLTWDIAEAQPRDDQFLTS